MGSRLAWYCRVDARRPGRSRFVDGRVVRARRLESSLGRRQAAMRDRASRATPTATRERSAGSSWPLRHVRMLAGSSAGPRSRRLRGVSLDQVLRGSQLLRGSASAMNSRPACEVRMLEGRARASGCLQIPAAGSPIDASACGCGCARARDLARRPGREFRGTEHQGRRIGGNVEGVGHELARARLSGEGASDRGRRRLSRGGVSKRSWLPWLSPWRAGEGDDGASEASRESDDEPKTLGVCSTRRTEARSDGVNRPADLDRRKVSSVGRDRHRMHGCSSLTIRVCTGQPDASSGLAAETLRDR